MGAKRGAVDAVVATVRHGFGQCHRHSLPDPGVVPPPEWPIDRVPVAVFGRDIAPWRSATQPPEYAIDDRAVLLGAATAPPVLCLNRQQTLQNTPFRFAQIAPAQACLQKAGLNQPERQPSTNLSTPPNPFSRERDNDWFPRRLRFMGEGKGWRLGDPVGRVREMPLGHHGQNLSPVARK